VLVPPSFVRSPGVVAASNGEQEAAIASRALTTVRAREVTVET
jgi:hypothetical protein